MMAFYDYDIIGARQSTCRLTPHMNPASDNLLPPGLTAVTGAEGSGKTRYLRRLSGDLPSESSHPDALWLDLGLPAHQQLTPQQVWDGLRVRCPQWSAALQQDLMGALGLRAHLDKQLYMLSTGSRRKVALVGLLASGATVTCLDQPYAALDLASIRVVRGFLQDMAAHRSRSWVVADYEADPLLEWSRVITLG